MEVVKSSPILIKHLTFSVQKHILKNLYPPIKKETGVNKSETNKIPFSSCPIYLFLSAHSLFSSRDGFAAIDPGVVQGNIDDIAKTVLTYFPKVNGSVTSVDNEIVIVNLGKEKGVTKGSPPNRLPGKGVFLSSGHGG
ncbi:MAG: hypothetical protein MPW15_19935 [Candidatus Manganitrophus sp.]|nr:hypothetical protein [Candidatus Manganitrophus sp.]